MTEKFVYEVGYPQSDGFHSFYHDKHFSPIHRVMVKQDSFIWGDKDEAAKLLERACQMEEYCVEHFGPPDPLKGKWFFISLMGGPTFCFAKKEHAIQFKLVFG